MATNKKFTREKKNSQVAIDIMTKKIEVFCRMCAVIFARIVLGWPSINESFPGHILAELMLQKITTKLKRKHTILAMMQFLMKMQMF